MQFIKKAFDSFDFPEHFLDYVNDKIYVFYLKVQPAKKIPYHLLQYLEGILARKMCFVVLQDSSKEVAIDGCAGRIHKRINREGFLK